MTDCYINDSAVYHRRRRPPSVWYNWRHGRGQMSFGFWRTMPVRPSVCLSIRRTGGSVRKTVRITQFPPCSSPIPLVFLWDKFHPEIPTGKSGYVKGRVGKTSHFYARQHICYSAYMLSPVRLSVCPSLRPSVTRVDHAKTVEDRIMKFSPYGSPIPLVFESKFHPEIPRGSPRAGR